MKNLAEFQIIGNIGSVRAVGATLKVAICANYNEQSESGEWKTHEYWNEVTVFGDQFKTRVKKLAVGDLVWARGRVRKSKYVRGEETVYTVDFIADELSALAHRDAAGAALA